MIILAAIGTVVRRREFNHLPPLGIFLILPTAAAFMPGA